MKKKILSLLTAITMLCVSSVSVFADDLSGFDFGDTSSSSSSSLGGFDFGDSSSSGNLGGFDFGDNSPVTTPEDNKPIISTEEVSEDCISIEMNIENRYKEAYELLCSLEIADKNTVLDTSKYITR